MSIFTEWVIKSRAVRNRSAALQKVDASVNKIVTAGYGPKDANLTQLKNDYVAWRTGSPAEFNQLKSLDGEFVKEFNARLPKKDQMAGTGATGVKPIGWSVVDYDSTKHFVTAQITGPDALPPLTTTEIQRINEAMRRVKFAVEASRDALLDVAKRKNFTSPMPVEESTFTDYFGAYDATRFSRVLDNFKALQIAVANGPEFVDLRNTAYGKTCYAACYRANLVIKNNGQLALSDKVNMFLGRAFLKQGGYEVTSNNTIGTLVHEFSHGVFSAVDVPPVNTTGAFIHARKSDDATHADFGETTDNSIQASTPVTAKLLAKHKPNYAVVNADCYGEFATEILVAKHG